ncbi:uncharacterized protein LOC134773858 [Penaeus indicus]|uniref:uncharacterized protein LOC134773858 n=1 Tax=Penaeus indicus TaxID=29960 RepID=UPI00300D255A
MKLLSMVLALFVALAGLMTLTSAMPEAVPNPVADPDPFKFKGGGGFYKGGYGGYRRFGYGGFRRGYGGYGGFGKKHFG